MEIIATILAKGAPNRCRDGRTTMCAIGVSETHGLIRIYPLSVRSDVSVSIWSTVRFELDRSKTDGRSESYKVIEFDVCGSISEKHDKLTLLDDCILRSGELDPIDYQNAARKSISIVKCDMKLGASLMPREDSDIVASSDEDGFALTQSEYPYKPYIEWISIQGKSHRTQLVGQEVYEGMRKNVATPFRIFENIHIGDPDYTHWMVLGNLKDRRNVWVCPHVHRLKKTTQTNMLENFQTGDGRPSGWPYETQEASNVRPVDPQMEFNFTT